MPDIEKIKRSQISTFLDTTPKGSNNTWKILGIGITSKAISYNPQINTEKWIIHDNATSSLDSNQKQSDVSQKMYKGDPCFEYAIGLRDKVASEVQTNVLDIDMWNGTGSSYPAKMSSAILAITSVGGDDAVLDYTLYYNGDPIEGTATIENGVPTFTPNE